MGKLVVTEFVTLDGVMEDPGGAEGGRGGWAFKFDQGPDGQKSKLDELMASDAQLLGRVTYEGFAKAWPTMEGTGRVRREDERDAQVRRLDDAGDTRNGTTRRSSRATSRRRSAS